MSQRYEPLEIPVVGTTLSIERAVELGSCERDNKRALKMPCIVPLHRLVEMIDADQKALDTVLRKVRRRKDSEGIVLCKNIYQLKEQLITIKQEVLNNERYAQEEESLQKITEIRKSSGWWHGLSFLGGSIAGGLAAFGTICALLFC